MRYRNCRLALFGILAMNLVCSTEASNLGADEARKAAGAWLKRNHYALGNELSKQIDSIETGTVNTKVVYYAVNLHPSGFLILSPDERFEPVIAFSAYGRHVPDENSPLYQLVLRDLTVRQEKAAKENETIVKNRIKWKMLIEKEASPVIDLGLLNLSDMRIMPLVQSLWGQEDEGGMPCYDYYTPPGSEPDADPNNNIRCGCVATAMAQVMRYHQHPSDPVGVSSYTVYVNGSPRMASTRGGDGYGGFYLWYEMPLIPGPYVTEVQREAIGALCHDAGVTVNMHYSSSGSGTSMRNIHGALSDFFRYSCAVYGVGSSDLAVSAGSIILQSMPAANINQMINPGLDAGYPSILGLDGPYAGHAVVADGYGYQDQTLYHHLNMGWYGRDNAWYALPDVNSVPAFEIIDACIYNIFPDGSGEIVSGRAIDANGLPMGGVLVKAYLGSSVVEQDFTNEKGIYALAHLPSEETYVIRAEKDGCLFAEQVVYVGKSVSQGDPNPTETTGNIWGLDFVNVDSRPPVAVEPAEPIEHLGSDPLELVLAATDDGLPNPPGRLELIICSLPEHGRLYDPNFGEVQTVPYVLMNDSNSIIYQPCRLFRGMDTFSFKANDGGVPPGGGDSNIAQVQIQLKDLEIGQISNYSNYPFYTTRQDCRMQLIYANQDLGQDQYIGGISLNVKQKPTIQLSQFTIRMQHTQMNQYPAERDFINTGWTTVHQNNELISSTGWKRFDFQTPFHFNGDDNLLIDISYNNSSSVFSVGQIYCFSAVNRDLIQVSNSLHGDPLLWTVSMFGGYISQNMAPVMRIHENVPNALSADFNTDCHVEQADLMLLAGAWLSQSGGSAYSDQFDIAEPPDYKINLKDFAVLASEWMRSIQ